MAQDIATLGLKVERTEVEQATQSLDKFAASGKKAEDAQKALTAQSAKLVATAQQIDLANRAAVTSFVTQASGVRATAQEFGKLTLAEQNAAKAIEIISQRTREQAEALRQAGLAAKYQTREMALKMGAALEMDASLAASALKASSAHGQHALSLGRIETALGSFVGHAIGVPPVIDRIVETFGGFALGGAVMAGALAGLAAVATVWEKITEEAHAAEKAQDAALAKLEEWSHKRHLDSGGEFGEDVHGAGESLRRAVEEKVNVIGLQTAGGAAAGVATAWDFFRGKTKEGMERAAEAVRDGREMLGEETTKLFLDQRAKTSATLADNIKSNNLAHGERQRALGLLREDLALMAQYQKAGVTGELRANLGRQIKELDEALHPKASGTGGAKETREWAAAMRDAERAIDAFNKAREEQTAFATASIEKAKQDVDATRRMIDAYRDGPAAVRALTDQLEIEAVTREFLAKTKDLDKAERDAQLAALQAEIRARQQLGHVLADEKDARDQNTAATKKAADDAQREQERRYRQVERAISQNIAGALDQLGQKGANIFRTMWDSARAGLNRFIADILAAKIMEKIGGVLGFKTPQQMQEQAGKDMKVAAEKQLEAAKRMQSAAGTSGGESGPGAPVPTTAMQKYMQQFLKVGASAVGGYEVGYGIGQTTGSKPVGAIGGAVSGAALGAQVGGLPGAVVGGIAGFIGGIIGAGDAARAAAERLRKAKEAFDTAFDAAKAEVAGDQLAIQIAQVHAQYNALRDALKEATPWLQEFIGTKLGMGTYAEKLKEVNRLEQVRVEQLKEEAAAMSRYFSEDLEVEQQRARATIAESEGRTAEAAQMRKDADRTAYNQEQERRLEAYRRTHQLVDDPNTNADDATVAANQQQYATLQNTVALNEQAFAVQQNTKAIDAFTTSLHNAPTGYKVAADIYRFSTPAPRPALPTNPFVPPTVPLNPPTLNASRAASPGRQITIAPVFHIDGTKTTAAQVKDIAVELKKIVVATLGSNADVSEGWGLLA